MLKEDEFQCAHCEGIFDKDLEFTEEEKEKELKENFPDDSKESCATVCDDCYAKIMGWIRSK